MSNADEGGVCGLWKNRLIIRSLLLEEDRQLIDLHWLEYKGSIPRAVIYRLSYIIYFISIIYFFIAMRNQ